MHKTSRFLIFIFSIFVFSQNAFSVSEKELLKMETEKLVYFIRNKDAASGERRSAVQVLSTRSADMTWPLLIEILRDPKENKALQGFASELLVAMKARHAIDELSDIAENRDEPFYARSLALNTLWRIDQKQALRIAKQIAENSFEENTSRVTAFTYLRLAPNDSAVSRIARSAFNSKMEAFEIRRAALEIIGLSDNQTFLNGFYKKLLYDVNEPAEFRAIAIQKYTYLGTEDIQSYLLQLIGNKKEDMTIRRAALASIAAKEDDLETILPRLKQIEQYVEKGNLKETIKKLIARTERKIKKAKAIQQKNYT